MKMNPFFPLLPITDFRKLGTGRKKRTFFVASKTGRLLFPGKVIQSKLYTTKTVTFDNRRVLRTDSGTIDGQVVFIFAPAEKIVEKWNWQVERERIEVLLNNVGTTTVFRAHHRVRRMRDIPSKLLKHPILHSYAIADLRRHL